MGVLFGSISLGLGYCPEVVFLRDPKIGGNSHKCSLVSRIIIHSMDFQVSE